MLFVYPLGKEFSHSTVSGTKPDSSCELMGTLSLLYIVKRVPFSDTIGKLLRPEKQ